MNYILSVYTVSACKEYLLPNINDQNYNLVLSRNLIRSESDLIVPMRIKDGMWSLRRTGEFRFFDSRSRESAFEQALSEQGLYFLVLSTGALITVTVRFSNRYFSVYPKFSMKQIKRISIGSAQGNTLCYNFCGIVSAHHAEIIKSENGFILNDLSKNGVYINGEKVDKTKALCYGDVINIYGLKIVFLQNYIAVNPLECFDDAGLKKLVLFAEEPDYMDPVKKEKTIVFHRSPRYIQNLECKKIIIDSPPNGAGVTRKPLRKTVGFCMVMLIPASIGLALAVFGNRLDFDINIRYAGVLQAVISILFGIMWVAIAVRKENRKEAAEKENYRQKCDQYLADSEELIKRTYDKNVEILRNTYPPASACCCYGRNTNVLWNRNRNHSDFLVQRLGVGDLASKIEVSLPNERFETTRENLLEKLYVMKDTYSVMHNVPIGIDLYKNKIIGIVGGMGNFGCYPVIYTLIAQIAANNCYTDVKMIFLCDKLNLENERIWKFTKWLPHVWSEDRKIRYLADDRKSAKEICSEILKELKLREYERAKQEIPYYLIFVENMEILAEDLKEYLFVKQDLGVTGIFLVNEAKDLPNSCQYVIENTERFCGMYSLTGFSETQIQIVFDQVMLKELDDFSRRLFSIRVAEKENNRMIPPMVTFCDMYGVRSLTELNVPERWKKNKTTEHICGLLGQKAGGMSCWLDVHEKHHGPHGLVAGTTGSGKSELLQTYILSLAVNYSPLDVVFFVIDYKGGGMANLLSGLPHLAGQISNLSGSQVRRAMVSIKSEILNRQKIFNLAGVNNINSYTWLSAEENGHIPVPHLFIVIDEFAELKREEPEFMNELIRVARIGRSLGIHLILATQKPAGTVDDNIWSNSKFHLCLRVQERQDSMDMLHRPDAAFISETGRGYLQVGNDEVFELFQSGWSGVEYTGEDDIGCHTVNRITITGREIEKEEKGLKIQRKTQLDATVEYLKKVSEEIGYVNPVRLWLPELPTYIYLDELEEYGHSIREENKFRVWTLEACVGLCDDPANQAQIPLIVDFARGGNHAVCGSISTGKSTFLLTLLFSLASRYTPQMLNIYVLDFSNRMLSSLEELPHIGGIVYEGDIDKVSKLFAMLEETLIQRKALLQGVSYAQYVKAEIARDPDAQYMPAILLVIDNYSEFRSKTDYCYDDRMLQFAKTCAGYGIFLMITAGGFSTSEIPAHLGDCIRTVLCLELNDPCVYSDVLRIPARAIEVIPEENKKGRGLVRRGESVLQFQTALAMHEEDEYERQEQIRVWCRKTGKSWNGRMARKIPEIPQNAIWNEFIQLEEVKSMLHMGNRLPIGYNQKNASVYGINLDQTYCYLISGKMRTGKTNLMKCMIAGAAGLGGESVVIDYGGELKAMAESVRVRYISTDRELYAYFNELQPQFIERNQFRHKLLENGATDEECRDQMKRYPGIFIMIGNFPDFVEHIHAPNQGVPMMENFVINLLDKGAYHQVYWFACMNQDDARGIVSNRVYSLFTRDRNGIHFGGNIAAQKALDFDYVKYSDRSTIQKPGIAMIPQRNEECVETVVVPLYR